MLTFSGVLGGAGEAQDRTTISYTIDEDTRAKAFDVMFALGESRLEPCCMKSAIKLLGVYGLQCVARMAQHRVGDLYAFSQTCLPGAGTIAFAFGDTILPEVQVSLHI